MSEREIIHPFKQKKEEAVASSSADQKELSVASAMSNDDPSICPKCGVRMGMAMLYDRRPVYYCDADRVTHPKE